jgi:uncharacterized protein
LISQRCFFWFVALAFFLTGCGYKTSPRPASDTIPEEISLLNAYAYSDRITLKWTIPRSNTDGSQLNDISGFKVYRASHGISEECEKCEEKKTLLANVDFQAPSNAIISEGEVTFVDKLVALGNTYYYWVSVYNLRGREGRVSREVSVVFGKEPQPPTSLRVLSEPDSMRLDWAPPDDTDGVKSYRIYRGVGDNPDDMKSIGNTKLTETYYVDKNIEKGRTYYYLVRSVQMNRGISFESKASNIAEAQTARLRWNPPENINTAATSNGIRIYWDPVKMDGEETRYNIFRSDSGRMLEKINQEPLSNPWFLDKGVMSGRTYRYAISAFPKDKPLEESSRAGSASIKYSR